MEQASYLVIPLVPHNAAVDKTAFFTSLLYLDIKEDACMDGADVFLYSVCLLMGNKNSGRATDKGSLLQDGGVDLHYGQSELKLYSL